MGDLCSERNKEVSRGHSTCFFLRRRKPPSKKKKEGRTEFLSQGIKPLRRFYMEKSDKRRSVQMHLSKEEEWTSDVPVLNGVAVSYAEQGQVDECKTGEEGTRALTHSNLIESVASLSNLECACRRVINNGGSAGIDGMSVKELGAWFSQHWQGLQTSLISGTYQPQGVRSVQIPKPKGGYRQLGIPTVQDRLVQQAINQILEPIYDSTFSPTSYGFRRGRSSHDALSQLSHYLSQEKTYIVDIDMAKFFDEVNHDRLMSRLRHRIADKLLLQLIHRYLQAGIMEGGVMTQRIKGTPQGSPLSPLLSNIVLDELDKELSKRGHLYVRYADDIVIATGSLRAAERVQTSVTSYIENHLKLRVNRTKSKISRPWELNYLGHSFLSNGTICLSKESEGRLKEKLRNLTRRNRGRSLEQVLNELRPILRGWLNYFHLAKMKNKLIALDSWLRRRLRCYRLKQCKRAIGMMRFLHKLGVPKKRAWTTAASRKGWWRKSATPACNEGMNKDWFDQQGLFNLTENYLVLNA